MVDRITTENRYWRQPVLDPKNYQRIIYDPGLVTRIILNRPRYLNALSHALLTELRDAWDRASEDQNCRVVVISGAGSCFSSGDDNNGLTPESAPTLWDGAARSPEELIKQYGSEAEVWHQYNIEHDQVIGYQNFRYLRVMPKPTIAMVHGWCIFNGFGIASSCDLVFASEDALFLGGGGGSPLSLFTVGYRKALELMYEHRFLTAREAMELRVINRVFSDFEALEKETMAFAYRVAESSPLAIQRGKESFLNTLDIMGWSTIHEIGRTPYRVVWRQDAEEGHRMRYEGKGRARTPVALANLAAKLKSEGKEVPAHVQKAIDRAAARNDKATWQRVLHVDWITDERRRARADASLKAYEEMRAEDERMKREECERRGLNYEDMRTPFEKMKGAY